MNTTTTNPAAAETNGVHRIRPAHGRLRRAAGAGLAAAALATLSLGLSGCAGTGAATETGAASDSAELSNVQQAGPFTITDAWVKATDTMMTGAFGEFENTSDAEVVIEDVTASVGGMFELHETIVQSDGSSVMQEKQGGFTVAPGETLTLAPGHDHIMLMKLDAPILPGDEVAITLQLADGGTAEFTVVAKEYTGAMETYAPDGSLGGHQHGGDHDHDMEHAPTETAGEE